MCNNLIAAYITVMMMQAVRISETSVYFDESTPRNIPVGCHLIVFNFLGNSSHLKKKLTGYKIPSSNFVYKCHLRYLPIQV